MKKAEAISILATSVRPREPKDRARYDEAVKMAIEALKCSETPKSSERTAEIAQDVKDGDLNWAIPSVLSNLVPAGVVADIVQDQRRLEESIHRIKQLTGISIDDLLDLFAQGHELKAPSAQPEERKKGAWINEGRIIRCNKCKIGYATVKGMKSALTYNFCPNCGADMRGGDSNE